MFIHSGMDCLPAKLAKPALRAHAGSAGVQVAACSALGNIALNSDTCTQAVVDAGALPLLVAALRAHAGSAGVQLAACIALWAIARDSSSRARLVVSAGALPLVDAALTAHRGHSHLQKWGTNLANKLRNP
jgi:hypothetical protein